jgi:hypothetical protein
MRDADLILTPTHLLVVLAFTERRAWLRPLIQQFNKAEVALPWLNGRRVVMGFAARSQPLPDAQPVLAQLAEAGSAHAERDGGVGASRSSPAACRLAETASSTWFRFGFARLSACSEQEDLRRRPIPTAADRSSRGLGAGKASAEHPGRLYCPVCRRRCRSAPTRER